jgi:isocitrate/isopropylmalate dehydrogenase
MAKYKIASLPGGGIGADVLQAARIGLDKVRLDADYILGRGLQPAGARHPWGTQRVH